MSTTALLTEAVRLKRIPFPHVRKVLELSAPFGCKIFPFGNNMTRTLVALVTLSFLGISKVPAQQSTDPTAARLESVAHGARLTPSDVKTLLSEAESGHAEAQYRLALVYEEGRLVSKDSVRSASWLMKSAEQGYAPAQRAMGMMYVHRESSKAEMWLRRAAEQGDSEAQFWLGAAYEQGWFGATDLQCALEWLRESAAQGHPDAQVALGHMYADGEGVAQDWGIAAEWYRKAAEHVPDLGGAGQGRNELGLLYLEGYGVPKDLVRAHMWFSLARNEKNLETAQFRMTPAQIRRAPHMAREWEEQHPTTAP